jgi:hypothetical protein
LNYLEMTVLYSSLCLHLIPSSGFTTLRLTNLESITWSKVDPVDQGQCLSIAVSNRLLNSRFECYYVFMGIVTDLSVHMLTIADNCWSFTHYKNIRNPLYGTPIYELYYFPFEEQEPHSVLLIAPGCTLRLIPSVNQLFHELEESLDQSGQANPSQARPKREDIQDICITQSKYHMIKDGKLHICPPSCEQSRQPTSYLQTNENAEWYP